MRSLIVRFAMFAALSLSLSCWAEAATINVTANALDVLNGANGSCSLREAIQNINDATTTYADCAPTGAYGAGDTINIPAGTYTIAIANVGGIHENLNATGDFDILKSVAIAGAGAGSTIIDAANLDNVFHVIGALTVSISGVTIRNGDGGVYNLAGATLTVSNSTISGNTASSSPGAGIYNGGTLNVTNSTISGNAATWMHGGGIYNNAGVVNITNSTISGNSGGFGGAIFNGGGSLTVTSSGISGNTAQNGGGIYSNGGSLTITNSTIGGVAPADGNTATANNGGGVYVFTGALTVTGSTIRNNTAGGTGGGVFDMAGNGATITSSTISDNTAAIAAGGIYMENALLTITGSTISNNTASANHGGGVHSLTNLSISNSTISGNTATLGQGGGVYGRRTVNISGSTISNNSGGAAGGGIYISFDGAVATNAAISSSTISGNTAGGQGGGGIYNTSAGAANTSVVTVTDTTISGNNGNVGAGIRNSGAGATASVSTTTISGNTSGAQGGGLYNDTNGTATLTNSTISGNSSTASDGGGVYTSSGSVAFANCTITNNDAATNTDGVYRTGGNLSFTNTIIAGNGAGDDCTGSYAGASSGNNLDSDNTCVLNQGSDMPGSALANLAALASNGGSTQTHALQAGSAAIDAGSCAQGADQRGVARPQGGTCDIGAYEARLYAVTAATSGSGAVADTNTVTGFDIACPGVCSDSVIEGTSVTLTATASAGYTFSGWSGDCAGTGNCALTVGAAKNVTATFTSGAVAGCANPGASNYNPAATVDDGSCVYPDPDFGGSGANSLDFGTGAVNSSSQKTITLKNTGPISAYIYRLDISGSAFSVVSDSCSGKAVWKDNTCDIVVSFNPSVGGSFTGTLNVWTNAARFNPLSVSLVGKATVFTVSPATLISPADGATLAGTKVTFEWTAGSDANGASVTDSAYVCERSDFTGCETPAITSRGMAIPAGLVVLLGLMAPFGFRNRRVRSVLLALIFMTAGGVTLWACGSDSSSSSQSGKSLTLKADTKYYWKVVTASANGSVESEARSFTTGK